MDRINIKNGTKEFDYGTDIWDFFNEFERSTLNYLHVNFSPPPGFKTTYSFVDANKDIHKSSFSPITVEKVYDYLHDNVDFQTEGPLILQLNGDVYEWFNTTNDKKPNYESASLLWQSSFMLKPRNKFRVDYLTEGNDTIIDAVDENHHRVLVLNQEHIAELEDVLNKLKKYDVNDQSDVIDWYKRLKEF